MTTHATEDPTNATVSATLPTQTVPTDAAPTPPVIDHVHAHSVKCYWDFTECQWVCSDV